jgi:hypothetical protein
MMTGGTSPTNWQDVFAPPGGGICSLTRRNCTSLHAAKGIENQFHAARSAQFVENPKQVVPYRVFAQVEFECNRLVPHILETLPAFRNEFIGEGLHSNALR